MRLSPENINIEGADGSARTRRQHCRLRWVRFLESHPILCASIVQHLCVADQFELYLRITDGIN